MKLKVNNVKSDHSGLVIGLLNKDKLNPDYSGIDDSVSVSCAGSS